MIEPYQQAFPCPGVILPGNDGHPYQQGANDGMTYRQWLVGQALQGLCANPELVTRHSASISQTVLNMALAAADGVISKL